MIKGLFSAIVGILFLSLLSDSLEATSRIFPHAGELQASPSFAAHGIDTPVNVTGAGWEIFSSGVIYQLLFDDTVQAVQIPISNPLEQPDMTFTVPGTTGVGFHSITVVLRFTSSGEQEVFRTSIAFEVRSGDFTFDGEVISKPRTVGTDSIQDVGDKNKDTKDTLVEESLAGLKDAGATIDDTLRGGVDKAVQAALAKKFKAITVNNLSIRWAFVLDPNDNVTAVKVTYRDFVTVLLPANAPKQLKNHEDGHVLIRQLLKDYAKTKFELAFAKAKGGNGDDADKLFSITFNSLKNLGDNAGDTYDSKKITDHGLQGGEDQQALARNRSMMRRRMRGRSEPAPPVTR